MLSRSEALVLSYVRKISVRAVLRGETAGEEEQNNSHTPRVCRTQRVILWRLSCPRQCMTDTKGIPLAPFFARGSVRGTQKGILWRPSCPRQFMSDVKGYPVVPFLPAACLLDTNRYPMVPVLPTTVVFRWPLDVPGRSPKSVSMLHA